MQQNITLLHGDSTVYRKYKYRFQPISRIMDILFFIIGLIHSFVDSIKAYNEV